MVFCLVSVFMTMQIYLGLIKHQNLTFFLYFCKNIFRES